jgi:hypothetical protein
MPSQGSPAPFILAWWAKPGEPTEEMVRTWVHGSLRHTGVWSGGIVPRTGTRCGRRGVRRGTELHYELAFFGGRVMYNGLLGDEQYHCPRAARAYSPQTVEITSLDLEVVSNATGERVFIDIPPAAVLIRSEPCSTIKHPRADQLLAQAQQRLLLLIQLLDQAKIDGPFAHDCWWCHTYGRQTVADAA